VPPRLLVPFCLRNGGRLETRRTRLSPPSKIARVAAICFVPITPRAAKARRRVQRLALKKRLFAPDLRRFSLKRDADPARPQEQPSLFLAVCWGAKALRTPPPGAEASGEFLSTWISGRQRESQPCLIEDALPWEKRKASLNADSAFHQQAGRTLNGALTHGGQDPPRPNGGEIEER
jgi:hypothetical protein